VRAVTGAIGGDLSHEFHIVAQTGESALYYDARLEELMKTKGDIDTNEVMSLYAAADEMYDEATCPLPADQLRQARGIEIGHIFCFGTKYSDSMNCQIMGENGQMLYPYMGSYGIGVSRLVGAIIEASHDEHGIIWPESVAPFKVGLVNIAPDNSDCTQACNQIYSHLQEQGVTVMLDDRDERPGVKFAEMDLIGLPWQVRVGPKGLAQGIVELKCRKTGETTEVLLASVVSQLNHKMAA
jgi:prolyl-tRNA synthetase